MARLHLLARTFTILIATAVSLDAAPTIRSIEPASAPATGGSIVRIRGTELVAPCRNLCIFPQVTFDGIPVQTLRIDDDGSVLVVVPPHPTGRVDVQYSTGYGDRLTLPSAFFYEPSGETVLLPLLISAVPGANGSLWRSDLRATNTTGAPIVFWLNECRVSAGCTENATIAPWETRTYSGSAPNGRFASPPTGIKLQLRVYDVSRAHQSAGVELPTLRSSDFSWTGIELPGVRIGEDFRGLLRIYGRKCNAAVRVDVVDGDGKVSESRELDLQGICDGRPSYAQLDLTTLLRNRSDEVTLRLSTPAERQPLWAFVSMTNNNTSEVTIISPAR